MKVISQDRCFSLGVLKILKDIYEDNSYNPADTDLNIYVTADLSVLEVVNLLSKYPPIDKCVFFLDEKTKNIIINGYPLLDKLVVDSHCTVNEARRVLEFAIINAQYKFKSHVIFKKSKLTVMEHTVLTLMMKGSKPREIARACNIGDKNIYNYRQRIMKKMGVNNLFELYCLQMTPALNLEIRKD